MSAQERDLIIGQILPEIFFQEENILEIEHFQNLVLRKILKFQNDLILKLFYQFVTDFRVDLNSLNSFGKRKKISELLKTNIQLKQTMLGVVLGLFTQENLDFYAIHKKELNKRIVNLLIERISSQA